MDEVLLEASRLALRRAQEALGVLLAADAPVDAAAEPAFEIAAPPTDQSWLTGRTDVQLFAARIEAAQRVYQDSRLDWVPTASVAFEPQLLTPSGLFQPSRTWRGFVACHVPILDAGHARVAKRQREVALGTARLELSELELQARAELRNARAAVESTERAVVNARLARPARRGSIEDYRPGVSCRRHDQPRAHRRATAGPRRGHRRGHRRGSGPAVAPRSARRTWALSSVAVPDSFRATLPHMSVRQSRGCRLLVPRRRASSSR